MVCGNWVNCLITLHSTTILALELECPLHPMVCIEGAKHLNEKEDSVIGKYMEIIPEVARKGIDFSSALT